MSFILRDTNNTNLSSILSGFNCRLCWVITCAVFFSILVIEGIILIPSYRAYQQDQLTKMEASGRMVVQHILLLAGPKASPEKLLQYGEVLVQNTVLQRVTIYRAESTLTGIFEDGPKQERIPISVITNKGINKKSCVNDCFDIKWLPNQVGGPFMIEGRLDGRGLKDAGSAFIWNTIGLVLIIACFVTIVTMMVLSRLVLTPILLLRHHIISAGNDPNTPEHHMLLTKRSDELGTVISAFNEMLKRLSDGMNALHTAKSNLEQQVEERTAALHATNQSLAAEVIERTLAEEKSRSLSRFPDENSNPILRVDRNGIILYANAASAPLLNIWKTENNQPLPMEWSQLVQDVLNTRTDKEVEQAVGKRIFSLRLAPIAEAGYVNLYGADITERKAYEEQLSLLANYDKLTGLPNRSLFRDRLQRAINLARKENKRMALLLVGLDGFKKINQEEGRDTGDELIKKVAQRLPTCVRDRDTVAHFSGDVFAIILSGIEEITDIADIAQKILEVLSEPFIVHDSTMEIHSSIGICLFPSDSKDPERLVHLADLAMFRAKADSRRNSYRFYEGGMNEAIKERRNLLRDLKWAIERDHMEIHYQPQMSLFDNRLIGMEALLRWRHPEKGLISPGRFIPLTEESGLIVPIGLWVLQKACKQNKQWQDAGLQPLKVAVNLSSVQFRETDLVETVQETIQASGLDPKFLELEITESVAMEGAEKTISTLESLHNLGLFLSIDDFGTGYSSLSYLKRFPVGKIKIDQSFVQDLENDSESAALCNAIIQLGHSLGLQVIAEGVETAEQLQIIRALGCDQVQGYYYSRPLDTEAFTRFVQEWEPDAINKMNR